MPDLQQYWRAIRALEQTLAPCVWLVSIGDPRRGQVGGCMVEAAATLAAKLLLAKTHRLAESKEIEAHQEQEQAAKKAAFEAKLRRQGISVVPLVK